MDGVKILSKTGSNPSRIQESEERPSEKLDKLDEEKEYYH
jgi:hypothetical protein